MKMNLQASLTWLVLLSAALLSQPASGSWLNSSGGQPWKKFSEWLKNIFKPKVPEAPQLRLVSKGDRCAGTVQVFFKDKWGTICGDTFSKDNGNVVCRQLGCGQAVHVFGESLSGHGKRPIHLDNVQCKGTEAYLWDCQHAGWGRHNCRHHEDVSVICSDSSSAPSSSTPGAETPTTPGTLTTLEEGSTDDSFTSAPATSSAELSTTVVSPSTASEARPNRDPEPGNPGLTHLSQYVRMLLLRYLNSLCRPTRPGIQSVKVQRCVRDPTCGNYYVPGQNIFRFRFRSPTDSRVCLRCKVFMFNSYCHPIQHHRGPLARGKRSTDGSIIVVIVPT